MHDVFRGMKNSFVFLSVFSLLLASFISTAQQRVLEGFIYDSHSHEALPFATVGIRGTTIGTATNVEGYFVLAVPAQLRDSILMCSYMGYKNYEKSISLLNDRPEIAMELDVFTLDEVEIRPWEPWDYIHNAMQHIDQNYPNNAYMTNEYYSEYITENDVFLKFTEAVIETYNPPYLLDSGSQSKVLKARRGADLGKLQFMRDKLDKKFEKEKRKAKKKGEDWQNEETIDAQIVAASFGGPEMILSADPLRDTASYLNSSHKKEYVYSIEGYSRFYGEQVIIIGFESKGKFEHQRQKGSVYISLESDAIMAIEYSSEVVIPVAIRPLLFVVGFGISNPEIHAMVHYKPIGTRWFLNDISIQGSMQLTKKKMFSKNDRSVFGMQMGLVNTKFELQKVHEIPKEERLNPEKPLEEQVAADPAFWRNYRVVRPGKLKLN
ncbi:MAG: carboxypeptidase-like regulatory domain-containing protein [Cyclobacteriaceae bacterium]|nr:carboxypeptidase-like regulatory domain-containing protein [Cyclobacteriaceae bacterium]